MPQRIIRPVVEHVKSPITLRMIAVFFALMFFVYIVITDYQQRQASAERYKAIVQYTEESRSALVSAKQQSEQFEASLKNTTALLVFMDEMAKSIHEVSEILRSQQKEHAVMINGARNKSPARTTRTPTRKKKVSSLKKCFRFEPKTKRIGDTEVIIHEGVSIPCD
jgi:hypothetical protein